MKNTTATYRSAPPLIRIRGLVKCFGALRALDGVDLDLNPGEALGLIGPNGSGKTTLFNTITGEVKADAGRVDLDGRDITGLAAHRVCRRGLVKTSQIVRPFAGLSVLENTMVGALHGQGLGMARARSESMDILELVGLAGAAGRPAGELTVAMRRRLELARALSCGPKAILLDENLAGLTPAEIEAALDLLRRINRAGVALIMVEHVLQAVMGLCTRIAVLDFGSKIADGSPEEVVRDPEVIEACLGHSAEEVIPKVERDDNA